MGSICYVSTILIILLYTYDRCKVVAEMVIMSKTHSSYLEKYKSYTDVVMMHFNVPMDTSLASFKFEADEKDFSIFGCEVNDVELYLKYGSPPVINPDNSKMPEKFLKSSRPKMHKLNFKSNKKANYLNITTPMPGDYFVAVYHPYTNPKSEGITQQGLTRMCSTFVDATLYVDATSAPILILEDKEVDLRLMPHKTKVYKFYVPESVDHVTIKSKNIVPCQDCLGIRILMGPNNIPFDDNDAIFSGDLYNTTFNDQEIWVEENTWYYITFSLINDNNDKPPQSIMFMNAVTSTFAIHYYTNKLNTNVSQLYYKNALTKTLRKDYALPYKEYDLIRLGNTDTFVYSYEMRSSNNDEVSPLSLNMSSTDLTVLKFKLSEFIDIGGTLHFIIVYKPNQNGNLYAKDNYVVIACIHGKSKLLPTWPNKCKDDDGNLIESQVILNKTTTNSSVLIPYPEPGIWYVTLQLYCDACESCKCTKSCRKTYSECRRNCERGCTVCTNCTETCHKSMKRNLGCENCDCYGGCMKKATPCNTSVIFDVGSFPCINGNCGKHGKCTFSLAEGFVYSACLCTDKYKGWDCTDDSDATSFGMILLELLLLVLSNLGFLPAAYFAVKRGYRVEAVVYFSTFFFSSFYHACDAGENVISFCITKLSVLQFSDFYSGLLAIWVTLIAMAYLNDNLSWILHISGCIVLAFCTTYDKTALWVFLLPSLVGLVIIAISWFWHYKKIGSLFPSKKYLCIILPIGATVVVIALITYALLQTQSNYKYLHSFWHLMMAIGVIILLPNQDTFLPKLS